MKAIIMAGGEGTRLRPVSSNRPKPMVRLFEKPVLGHIINLLKQNGIDESCLTLRYLPHAVTDYVGDGSEFGTKIQCRIESEPLGTAGSVRACSDFLGSDDFLVISGDCVCDFDLRQCINFHRQRGADATIVLYAHPDPMEYGIVLTGADGRVERFMEKPSGDKVFTDLINTGIYILSSSALELVPEKVSYDFGKDLFPALLNSGKKVYGVRANGYWCDIGSCGAYLQCAMDMLDGKYTLEQTAPEKDGVWSYDSFPPDIKINQPCYIGKDSVLKSGCTIGPYAVLGEGSHVGEGAIVQHSMVDGAHIGSRASLSGSIVCKGSSVRSGAMLLEGSVVGEGTIVGEDTTIYERVRIWPGKELPAGSRITENLVSGMLRSGLHFAGGGIMSGDISVDITPEACFAIGSAAAADGGRVGVGFAGGTAANTAALAISCGVCSAGGETVELDGEYASVISYATNLYGLPWGIFIRQAMGRLTLRFFGKKGLKITRDKERKIESTLSGGDFLRADGDRVGDIRHTAGNEESYIASAVQRGDLGGSSPVKVSIQGNDSQNRAAQKALENMGAEITAKGIGIPALYISGDGMTLYADDEKGHRIDSSRILTILALVEFENGSGTVAVPYTSPAALDIMAMDLGTKVLRLGRDKGAEELYCRQPYMRDGVFAAARLIGAIRLRGDSLSTLSQRVPEFASIRREVPVIHAKAAVMRELQASLLEFSTELFSGIRSNTGKGWVHIAPSSSRQVIKISGEAADVEAAEEICSRFERQAKEIDGHI